MGTDPTVAMISRRCGSWTHHRRRPWSPAGGGLSPHVRGKEGLTRFRCALPRSIPACAGESVSLPAASRWSWVYPRMCGGK